MNYFHYQKYHFNDDKRQTNLDIDIHTCTYVERERYVHRAVNIHGQVTVI